VLHISVKKLPLPVLLDSFSYLVLVFQSQTVFIHHPLIQLQHFICIIDRKTAGISKLRYRKHRREKSPAYSVKGPEKTQLLFLYAFILFPYTQLYLFRCLIGKGKHHHALKGYPFDKVQIQYLVNQYCSFSTAHLGIQKQHPVVVQYSGLLILVQLIHILKKLLKRLLILPFKLFIQILHIRLHLLC